jgi:ELWxxDGT repeat protein
MMRSSLVRSDRKTKAMRRRDRRNVHSSDRQSRRRRLAPAIEPLESRLLLAFTPELLADINIFGVSASPDSLTEFNGAVVFVADDGLTGSELWTSDGTEAGTVQIADLLAGPAGSQPEDLTIVGGELFFTAIDEDDELDLWKSDGTTAGTVKVFDADAADVYYMSDLTESGGKLFFSAYESATGYELWVSDGTSAGTTLVKDINPDQTIIDRPQELTDVNGTLFFTTYQNGYYNRELFKSDGTAAGTVLVADIDGDPLESSNPSYLTNVGGTLFFAAEDIADGVELYKSDGTTAGTVQIANLNSGSASSYPQDLTPFSGQLFFAANDGTGRQLFKSDGNSITPVANTTGSGDPSNPTDLEVVGSELFFASIGGVVAGPVSAASPTLTTSNSNTSSGTTAALVISVSLPDRGRIRSATVTGTSFTAREGGLGKIGDPGVGLSTLAVDDLYIADIDNNQLAVNAWDWTITDPAGLTEIDFSGFVSGSDFDGVNEGVRFELFLNGSGTATSSFDVTGPALDNWGADRDADNLAFNHSGNASTTTATVRLTFRNELPDRNDAGNREAFAVGATLTAIGGTSGTAGRELFKTDGTNTGLVKNIAFVGSSNPDDLTEVNGQLFFTADDPITSGRELWVSDGTEPGTQLVQDIRTGSDSSGVPLSGDPQHLTEINNQLFFTVIDDLNDRELWSSDGTSAGTDQVKNINAGSQDANIQQVTPVGNRVFFVADDGIRGEAVWVADPVAGTVTLAADVSGSSTDKVSGLTEFNGGVAFFNDSAGVHHTDGTTTTLLTTNTPVDLEGANPLFVEANGLLFLVFDEVGFGEELFTITPAGAISRVDDLYAGATGSDPRQLVAFNNQIYFSASSFDGTGVTGVELFSSDGVTISEVKDINGSVGASSFPMDLTASAGQLYFTADDGTNGREVWVSDGSVGSAQLLEVRSGAISANPTNLTAANGMLYFAANNGSNGNEPFVSDGTPAGTIMIGNLNSGDSNPSDFLGVGSTVYFSAFQSATGRELYRTDGTFAGTAIVEDLDLGPASTNPVPLADAGSDRVLVAAGTGIDRALWAAGGPIAGISIASHFDADQIVTIGPDFLAFGDDGFYGNEVYALKEGAPQVEAVEISGGTVQRSSISNLSLTFNSEVDITGDPFSIVNTTTAETVNHSAVVTELNGKTVVDITFISGPSVNANGLLADGTYELTVNSGQVHSLGVALDGNGDGTSGGNYVFGDEAVDKFFRKFGDNDGSNLVDLFDFAAFRATFGLTQGSPGYNEALDNDGGGLVDLFDFAAFRGNFGT